MPQVSLDRLIAEKEPTVISEELTRAGIQVSESLKYLCPTSDDDGARGIDRAGDICPCFVHEAQCRA